MNLVYVWFLPVFFFNSLSLSFHHVILFSVCIVVFKETELIEEELLGLLVPKMQR